MLYTAFISLLFSGSALLAFAVLVRMAQSYGSKIAQALRNLTIEGFVVAPRAAFVYVPQGSRRRSMRRSTPGPSQFTDLAPHRAGVGRLAA